MTAEDNPTTFYPQIFTLNWPFEIPDPQIKILYQTTDWILAIDSQWNYVVSLTYQAQKIDQFIYKGKFEHETLQSFYLYNTLHDM